MKRSSRIFFALFALALAAFPRRAAAQTVTWVGANGLDWSSQGAWSGGGSPPGPSNDAVVNMGQVTLTNPSGDTAHTLYVDTSNSQSIPAMIIEGGSLATTNAYIGNSGGSDSEVDVTSGTWNNGGSFVVGNSGTGTLKVSGGTVNTQFFTLGNTAGSNGTVTISGSGVVSSEFYVGYNGVGTLNLSSGGGYVVGGDIGYNAGSNGTVNITGGTWSSGFVVGLSGTGTLNASDASVTFGGLLIGNNAGSNGTVNMSAGILKGTLNLGVAGKGTLNLSGGTITAGGDIGQTVGANGSLVITGGTWNVGTTGTGGALGIGTVYIGHAGTGAVTVNGGYVNGGDFYYIGQNVGSSGTLVVSSGSLITAISAARGYVVVGSGSGNGTLLVNGGYLAGNYGVIGDYAGTSGTATVTSGTWVNSGSLFVGNRTAGVLNIGGGVVTSGSGAVIGATDTSIPGSLGDSSGTANVTSGSWINAADLTVGTQTGTGALNIGGGYVSDANAYIGTGSNQGGLGTATVTGGTWATSGTLAVGFQGTGTLSVTGGSVAPGVLNIASGTTSSFGEVNVSGSGSIIVGGGTGSVNVAGTSNSTGVLKINSGGSITSGTIKIGSFGTGMFDITDSSVFNARGVNGQGGSVNVNFILSGTGTYPTAFSGTLNVTKSGPGTAILTGSSNYTGTASINAGSLQLGNGGANARLSAISIIDNGTLAANAATNGIISGNISGTGSLLQIGGSLLIGGTDTYTGGTVIKSGTLMMNAGGATITHTGANVVVGDTGGDNGTFQLSGAVSDLSGVVGNGAGAIGTVDVGINGTGTWNNSGTVTVGNSGTGTLNLQGAGAVNIAGGAGTLVLGENAGSLGTLGLSGAGKSASFGTLNAAVVTVGSGTGIVNFSGTGVFAPELEGSLSVNLTSSADTVFTGSNTYTGMTTIGPSGTLQIGNGGATGSLGTGDVVDNKLLAYDRSDAVTVSNNISGSGAFTQIGTGTVVLSGSNSYTGTTTVSAGALTMNGVNVSSPTVVNGGLLNGSGTSGNVTVNSGGSVTAGDAPGSNTMTTLALNGSATYAAQIAAPGGGSYTGPGNHPVAGSDYSQTMLTGTANGQTVLTLGAGSILQLTITGTLPAGGIASAGNPYNPAGSNSTLDNYFILNPGNGTDVTSGSFTMVTANGVSFTTIDYSAGNLVGGVGGDGSFTLDGENWVISYTGNEATNSTTGGNAVVVTAAQPVPVMPEPWVAMLALGAAGMVMVGRRCRMTNDE